MITFTEFTLDRHEKKRMTLQIKDAIVHEIILSNQKLSREELELYYGEGLEDIDYLQLSSMNCLRIVLRVGINELEQPVFKVISISRDFYDEGLQELEIMGAEIKTEPNYFLSMAQFATEPVTVTQLEQPIRVPIITH
jgi:hypothetical protein